MMAGKPSFNQNVCNCLKVIFTFYFSIILNSFLV